MRRAAHPRLPERYLRSERRRDRLRRAAALGFAFLAVVFLSAVGTLAFQGQFGLRTSLPSLARFLDNSTDHDARRAALASGRVQAAQFVDKLTEIANDAGDPLQEEARAYLVQIRRRIPATKDSPNAATPDHR